jgi:hypothetical protein
MPRIYPPKWCRNDQLIGCNKCDDFLECDNKIIELSNLLKNSSELTTNTTTIIIYYGYCQRLAKYFLSLPDTWPVGAVQKNFWDSTKEKALKPKFREYFLT